MTLDCSEKMIQKAASLVTSETIKFNYSSEVDLEQPIDIMPAFIPTHNQGHDGNLVGSSAEELLKGLAELDRKKVYFIRNGMNNDKGHYQILFYDNQGWMLYSGRHGYRQVTSDDKVITNCCLIVSGTWGTADRQNAIYYKEATPERIKDVANFIYTCRTFDETSAIENAGKDNGYIHGIELVVASVKKVEKETQQENITHQQQNNTSQQQENVYEETPAFQEYKRRIQNHKTKLTNDLKENFFTKLFSCFFGRSRAIKRIKLMALKNLDEAKDMEQLVNAASNYETNGIVKHGFFSTTKKIVNDLCNEKRIYKPL